jgi:hypothetical protein
MNFINNSLIKLLQKIKNYAYSLFQSAGLEERISTFNYKSDKPR